MMEMSSIKDLTLPLFAVLVYFGYFLLILLLCLFLLYIFIRPYHVDESVPGPKRIPWLGVTFGQESSVYLEGDFSWSKWPSLSILLSREYNYKTWGGPTLNVGFGGAFFNIVSPACLEHVLRRNFDNYVKGKVARKCLQELLGTGIFTADGNVWKVHRKLITALLTKQIVTQQAFPLLLEKLQEVETLLQQTASNNATIDIQDLCYRMTMDVFMKMAFGVQLDSVENDSRYTEFLQAFSELQYQCHQRFNDLFWEWRQYFSWGEREQKIRQLAKVIDDFCFQVIEKHEHSGTDIISTFIQQSQVRGDSLPTNREIRDLVMNFLLAGRDSTACGLSWTLYELTKHPDAADKIREEVQQHISNRKYTHGTVEQLEYTHAVVMEALRFHPPVPDDFKFSIKDDVLPDGTRIPAGSCVMYSINTINHSDRVWGDNGNEFIPDRFLGKVEPSPFRYPVFHAGPRTCPGKPLALMEIKTALAYLLPRFDFIDKVGHSGDYTWTLVMSMAGGFPVKVHTRD